VLKGVFNLPANQPQQAIHDHTSKFIFRVLDLFAVELYFVGDALGVVQHHDAISYVVFCKQLLPPQLILAASVCHLA